MHKGKCCPTGFRFTRSDEIEKPASLERHLKAKVSSIEIFRLGKVWGRD